MVRLKTQGRVFRPLRVPPIAGRFPVAGFALQANRASNMAARD